jgi:hypothetical protein
MLNMAFLMSGFGIESAPLAILIGVIKSAIRSETDRGVVLLIDARFNERRYRRLFPAWWNYLRVRHTDGLREAVGSFWERRSD